MSASPTPNNPGYLTAFFAGYVSPLAQAVKQRLEQLNISVTNLTLSNLEDYENQGQSIPAAYGFYFLPEKLAGRPANTQFRTDLTRVLAISGSQTKFCLVMRDPAEYYYTHHPSLFPHFSTLQADVKNHQNHLISCLDVVKKDQTKNTRIIVVRDCLGPEIKRDAPLLSEAPFLFLPNAIQILNNQPSIYPISFKSAAGQIVKTLFSQHSRHQLYSLQGNQAISLGVINQQLRSLIVGQGSPVIVSLETRPSKLPSTQIVSRSVENLPDLIGLTAQWCLDHPIIIKPPSIISQDSDPKPFSSPKTITKLAVAKKPKPKILKLPSLPRKTNFALTLTIFGLISFLLIALVGTPLLFFRLFLGSFQAIRAQNPDKASRLAVTAQFIYPVAKPASVIYLPFLKILGGGVSNHQLKDFFHYSFLGLNQLKQAPQIIDQSHQLVSKMISGQKGDVFANFSVFSEYSQKTYETVSGFEAFLLDVNQSKLKPYLKIPLNSALSQITQSRAVLYSLSQFLTVARELLGENGSKTYLVLLQNNHELRATGGFIGSFALMSFDQGKLIDIETHDVYAADGQLRGHVEPPAALKTHLGEANWYLRDSNWDPNFPTSARRAEWFLSKEMNRQVDGTIAIDLYTVQKLLRVVGEITLPDYDETITADNLFQRAEYHSELNFFAGSTSKKDFLSALINAIYERLSAPDREWGIDLFNIILESAQEAHLQISLRDESLESSLDDSFFSGSVVDPICQVTDPKNCLVDYFGVVDSNVGVNKVNYFINRSISHQITLNPQTVSAQTSVIWQNSATSTAWPAGIYKNYVRFVIPQYASVVDLTVNGQKILADKLAIEVRHQKKYIGTYLEVPIQSQVTAVLTSQYQLESAVPQGYTLLLYFEKQAGTGQDPLDLTIDNQSSLTMYQSGLPTQTNQYTSSTTGLTDRSLVVDLKP